MRRNHLVVEIMLLSLTTAAQMTRTALRAYSRAGSNESGAEAEAEGAREGDPARAAGAYLALCL